MSCELDKEQEIEDIIPTPRNLLQGEVEKLEIAVHHLLEANINSSLEFDKFITLEQKKLRITLGAINLLYVYRCMVKAGQIERYKYIEQFLKSKTCRSQSGVMVVTVVTSPWPKSSEQNYGPDVEGSVHDADAFTKPEETIKLSKKNKTFSCKYDCFYCPSEPGQPRSYIKKEPAVARANQHRFAAINQFRDRGLTYLINGHPFDKVELIVLGGTWTSYPRDYQDDFICDLYYAANTFYNKDYETNPREKKTLEEEILMNETSFCRIIGLTLETRPDQINAEEIIRFRRFGVTRVQLGVQHVDKDILQYVNRGCYTEDAINAIKLLKDSCYKVDIHLMPDLPSSSPEKDRSMFEFVLNSPDLQVDQWKIYPCAVVPWTRIELWYNNYKRGYDTETNPEGLTRVDNRVYHPYANDEIEDVIIKIGKCEIKSSPLIELLMCVKANVHPWIRLNRIVRDIPGLYITGGNDRENLRQVLQSEMKKKSIANDKPDFICKCIRCREVKGRIPEDNVQLVVREYDASGGDEYFISFESEDFSVIYGFLRLRVSKNSGIEVFPELAKTSLIRELHVYGNVVPVSEKKEDGSIDAVQHMGFGKKLLRKAEEMSAKLGYKQVAVIAGVGVRNYYRKQGYLDREGLGNFQVKNLEGLEIEPIPCVTIPKPKPCQIALQEKVIPGAYEEKMKAFAVPRKVKAYDTLNFELKQKKKAEAEENKLAEELDNPIGDMFAFDDQAFGESLIESTKNNDNNESTTSTTSTSTTTPEAAQQAQPEIKAEAKPEQPKVEVKPEQPKPEVKAEVKPEQPKAEVKPEQPKAEVKPKESKSEVKPQQQESNSIKTLPRTMNKGEVFMPRFFEIVALLSLIIMYLLS